MSHFDDLLERLYPVPKEAAPGADCPYYLLFRRAPSERHYLIKKWAVLVDICKAAAEKAAAGEDYWLVNLLGCDERALEDHAFKVYCVLAAPDGQLITLEHPLQPNPDGEPTWRSIHRAFGGAEPLERELADLFGVRIKPAPKTRPARPVLIGDYPAGYYPLRSDAPASPADATQPDSPHVGAPDSEGVSDAKSGGHPTSQGTRSVLPEGVMILPVGPIHAGVIQAGYFAFHLAGEVVEQLPVQLGFTHRGIEKLFERQSMMDGWRLAERVAGDSAFAHSLAYCQAVESLAGVLLPEVAGGRAEAQGPLAVESLSGVRLPPAAVLWRVLLLELERLCNHLADVAAIVHDMAFDALSSPMTVVQESLVRLAAQLTGHRLLRGVNRPGGLVFPDADRTWAVLPGLAKQVDGLVKRFLDLAIPVTELPACRDRLIATGVLRQSKAKQLGAAGLPARASGLIERDFRLRHPCGGYAWGGVGDRIRAQIKQTTPIEGAEDLKRRIIIRRNVDLTGDVFARTLLRLAESETSARIIDLVAAELRGLGPAAPCHVDIAPALRSAYNFDFGLGYAEGWRGEVCYWLMKGPRGGIYRCKVRDPSVFNWPALAAAVERKRRFAGEPGTERHHENILADFPLINKSFNLSYAGTDL